MELFRGRLAPKPFALAVTAVYIAGIGAHALLSSEVTGHAGPWPFIIAQALLVTIWLVLHIRRLRDAGQGPAAAVGVAAVYGLSLALLLMLVAFFTNPNVVGPIGVEPSEATVEATPLAIFLLAVLFNRDFGVFMTILKALILIAFMPAVLSLIFSIHAAMRPRA